MQKIRLLAIIIFCSKSILAQQDNSFKITASLTGFGASYEINPAKVLYVEAGLSSAVTVSRLNLQSKLALYASEKFKLKLGVEAAYIYGALKIGGVYIDYYKYPNFLFMPVLSLEGKVLGIQIPVIVNRNLNTFFPIIGITLNVSKDEPAKRIEKKKKKKNN